MEILQSKVGNLRCIFMFVAVYFVLVRLNADDMRSFFVVFSTLTTLWLFFLSVVKKITPI